MAEQTERSRAAKAADVEARKELKAKGREITELQNLNRESGCVRAGTMGTPT